jgi:hypothetical protein
MAGKTYIKTGTNTWSRVKKIYLKTGGITWQAVRKAYLKTGNSTWKKIYDSTSNRPFIGNDIPKIRLNTFRTNSTTDFSGTVNDPVNPVVEAPPVQQMGPPTTTPTVGWPSGTIGNHLWGYDGTWTSGNGSTITFIYQWLYNLTGNSNDNIFDPQFYVTDTSSSRNTSSTGRADMLTNTASYLGYNDGDYFDKNFLTFRVGASNSAGGPIFSESTPVYIVRQKPTGTIDMINTSVDAPETLAASFSYSNEWYRKTDVLDSKIEWFAIDAMGDPLTETNRVATETLSGVTVTGTTTKSGTVYHIANIPNKIYAVRLTLNNSNTQAAVIPISGFTPNLPFTTEDYSTPGSTLTVTTLNILDYYNQKGTDNRGYIPNGGLFKIQSNVTGVDGSTTYRIRYRMYNWQNNSYYGMDGTNYGSSASSAWTTRTGSNSSFGFGGTLINNITVSGTTATLTHNETISSSSFGSTTYDGGQDRWQIEIEVSALKNSVRKYYADVVGGIPYYVSRAATSTLSASPSNAQVNQNVTLSGSFGGLGGGSSYPRQYRIYYGDGTDSGYLPAGEYSYGTANPSFSVIKQYSSNGEYFPYIITMPDYQTTSTSLVVAAALNPPTSISIASVSRYDANTVSVTLSHSGGSGPYYQMYWVNNSSSPVTQSYDAAGTGSTITDTFSPSDNYTAYFYVRSSTENLGNSTNGGSGTAGTYSNYSSLSPNPSYTFLQPTGTVSVSPSSGTGGTTEFTATPSVSSAPNSQISYQWQYFEGGSFGWVALSNATSSTYTPPSNYASIYGSSLRCQITANNGVGDTLTTASSTVTVSAAATKLSTPTNVVASDNLSTGIQVSWTNVANAATYGVWWGGVPGYDNSPDLGGPNNNGGVSITSSPFLDTGAPVGSRNYYVQAFPSTGSTSFLKSDWSAGDSGTRIEAPVKLSTPTGVNATDNRTDGVNITWNAVSGASYYGIWWGGPPGYDNTPDFQNIFGTSYLDTTISAGSSRDYYVQAFASGNPSGTKSDWGGPDNGTRANLVVNYTVTWNANGGSVSPSSNVVTAGSSVTAPTPTRSGYTFDYWYDNSFSYIVYAGGSFTPPSSITMNASWTQIVVQTPAITSGPNISWASGNNFTLSATASNATNLEFQVQFADNDGGPVLSTQTFFFGASTGGGTTGPQQYSWARTRVRANNSSTGLSSSFTGYTDWA